MARLKTNSLKKMAKDLIKQHGKDDLHFIALQLYNSSLSGPDFNFCIKIVRSVL